MTGLKLYMLLLGCRPAGRKIEQHDIFFCIGTSLKEIIPDIIGSWPGAGNIHIDAWREVTTVNGFSINVLPKEMNTGKHTDEKLFFINLGGYKAGEFEEFHYKMLAVAKEKKLAVTLSKNTAFFKHTGFKGAIAHIDDKYGIDVDDLYEIQDILPTAIKEKYVINLIADNDITADEMHLGYLPLTKIL